LHPAAVAAAPGLAGVHYDALEGGSLKTIGVPAGSGNSRL
jgi:hypothetical protein